eukprot:9653454-Alexandrium_andersonii.AAC.1
MLPAPEAPEWGRVIARGTLDAETGGLIVYQNACGVHAGFAWHGSSPAGRSRVITLSLIHISEPTRLALI